MSENIFIKDDFLLETKTASRLYFDYAEGMPIIDYHNHLDPANIAANTKFADITALWISGDHYKWRAMRANGVGEQFITGNKSSKEKFEKWAWTVPYTARNPLYHWTHLELLRYFDISELLSEDNAEMLYHQTTDALQEDSYATRSLLHRMNVELVCTTDDPCDDLVHHKHQLQADDKLKLLPGFRPDKFIQIDQDGFVDHIRRLEKVCDVEINGLLDLVECLQDRVDYFHDLGCRLSDHGLSQIYSSSFTEEEVNTILQKVLAGKSIYKGEAIQYKSALLYFLARMYYAKDWTVQYHLGALRNNNNRLANSFGADAGCDSIGDFEQANAMSRFFNMLDEEEKLCRTIIYNLNPRDNALFATMAGNFNDGSIPAKMQWGSAWWFLDQKDGMEEQLNVLSNMGLISRFIGMLTDSRSFLSFPRHEYFRRILCNLFGNDIEMGLLPNDINWIGQMVQNICYHNAKSYFKF